MSKTTKHKYKQKDLEYLIIQAQKNDIKAIEEIIKRIQKNIFTMFSYLTDTRNDIADLTQETLIKIAKNIKNINDITKFKTWVDRIATNIYIDYLKKISKNNKIEYNIDKLLEIKDKIGCEPGDKCLYSEIEKLIKAALLALPSNLRIVIILREFEGLSYEDISEITNTTLGTVKSRISRARIRLKEELKEFI